MQDADIWIVWFLTFAANAAGVLLLLYFGAAGMATNNLGKISPALLVAFVAIAVPTWMSVRLMLKRKFGLGIASTFLLLPSLFVVGFIYA